MRDVVIGQVDYTVFVRLASTTGAPVTGLVHTDIDIAYTRVETDNDVTTSDVTPATLASITASHLDWGFIEVHATDHPGLYRLDIADAVFASGAWEAVVTVTDASGTDFYATDLGFRLVGVDPQTAVRAANVTQWLGTTPNATKNGDLPVVRSAARKQWHVRIDGNDTTGDGTDALPYALPRKAATSSAAYDEIEVGNGLFVMTAITTLKDHSILRGQGRANTRLLVAYNAASTGAIWHQHATFQDLTVQFAHYRFTVGSTGASAGNIVFTVTTDGIDPQPTTVAYNASAGTIQSALEALENVGTGNVTVTGSSPAWEVLFAPTTGTPNEAATHIRLTVAGSGGYNGTLSVYQNDYSILVNGNGSIAGDLLTPRIVTRFERCDLIGDSDTINLLSNSETYFEDCRLVSRWDTTNAAGDARLVHFTNSEIISYGDTQVDSNPAVRFAIGIYAGLATEIVLVNTNLDIRNGQNGTYGIVGESGQRIVMYGGRIHVEGTGTVRAVDNTNGATIILVDVDVDRTKVHDPSGLVQYTTSTGLAHTGTATAGAAATITLASAASSTTNLYVGAMIRIESGTGVGQTRTVIAYNGTTKAATVDRVWVTNPASGSVYSVLQLAGPAVDANLAVSRVTLTDTTTTGGSGASAADIWTYANRLLTDGSIRVATPYQTGRRTILRNGSYANTNGNAITITKGVEFTWPSTIFSVPWTVTLYMEPTEETLGITAAAVSLASGTGVAGTVDSTSSVRFDLTKAHTAVLSIGRGNGAYRYVVLATTGSGASAKQWLLEGGVVDVVDDLVTA